MAGVDVDDIQAAAGLCGDGGVSGVLRRFLRRPALRAQRRLAGHGARAAAPQLPQLVPAAVSVRVREGQGGFSLTSTKSPAHAPDPAGPLIAAFAADVAAGCARTPRMVPPRWLYDDLGSALF